MRILPPPSAAVLLLLLNTFALNISLTNAATNYNGNGNKYAWGHAESFQGEDCLSMVTDYVRPGDGQKYLLLACLTNDFQLLGVPEVDTVWIKTKMSTGELLPGETRLGFPDWTTVHSFLLDEKPTIFINSEDDGATIRSRQLASTKRTGARTLAILRVESDGGGNTTTHTEEELFAEIMSETDVCMRTQIAACSFDQLTLSPPNQTDPQKMVIGLNANGVGSYTTGLTAPWGGFDLVTNYNAFFNYLNSIIGQFFGANQGLKTDFVMVCLPPGTIMGDGSVGSYNSFLSYYNSEVCTYTSHNMHELGHNLDVDHGQDDDGLGGIDAQGDQIGYMGAYYNQVHGPQMCYNAAKSFQLGWYASKTTTCSPSPCNPCEVSLGGFVSYEDPTVDTVLLKLQDTTSDLDYYLTYNHAIDFNQGTQEGANQVVINTQAGEGIDRAFSSLAALLDVGMSTTFVGGYNVTANLTVEVLDIVNGVASIRASTGTCSNPGTIGDPHFRTWQNEHYEYHGQCDLVLVKDPTFGHNKGLEVQIRTKLIRYWSYIKSAVIRIGTDILEVQGDAEMQGIAKYWFNLEYQAPVDTMGGGLFPVDIHIRSARKRIVTIDLDAVYPGQKIVISTWKEFVKVDFVNPTQESYGNSVGMLGDFQTGQTFGRDGTTVLNDFWSLGEEWQVLPSDDMLFFATEYPQFPEKCLEPEEAQGDRRRRRLDESSVSMEEAEEACSQLQDPLTIKDCVYDILATQDLDMVGAF